MLILRKFLRWMAITLLGLSVFVAIAGRMYQSIAETSDLESFPAPGRLFKVEGYSMHIHCQGVGSPTVIIEQGLGLYSSAWDNINAEIAKSTRICAYDRVGMGYSEPMPIDSTLSHNDVVTRLASLLDAAGENDDLVLVGYSAGGVYIRGFQRLYPERVVGLVLVDSSHEQQDSRFPLLPEDAVPENPYLPMEIAQYLESFGIFRILGLIENQVDALLIDDSLREKVMAQYHFSHSIRAQLTEIKTFREDPQKSTAPTSLGDLPVTVITQGAPVTLPENSPDFLTLDFLQDQRAVWNTMQKELAELSTDSEHMIAKESDHLIHAHAPQLIVEAVRGMLPRARDYREGTHNNQIN